MTTNDPSWGSRCPSCGFSVASDWNFCTECRFTLRTHCSQCGERIGRRGHARCKVSDPVEDLVWAEAHQVYATTLIGTGGLLIEIRYRKRRRALEDDGVAHGMARWFARLRSHMALGFALDSAPVAVDAERWRALVRRVVVSHDSAAEQELNDMGFAVERTIFRSRRMRDIVAGLDGH